MRTKLIVDGIDISLDRISKKKKLSKQEVLAILKILPQDLGPTNALQILGRHQR